MPSVVGQRDWLRIGRARGALLIAGAGAEPLELHFPVPDGRYRVSAVVLGDLTIETGPHTVRTAGRTAEVDPTKPLTGEVVALGEVEVRGASFQARVQPGDAPGMLRSFEFVPPGFVAVPDAPLKQAALVERLRMLGYIE